MLANRERLAIRDWGIANTTLEEERVRVRVRIRDWGIANSRLEEANPDQHPHTKP